MGQLFGAIFPFFFGVILFRIPQIDFNVNLDNVFGEIRPMKVYFPNSTGNYSSPCLLYRRRILNVQKPYFRNAFGAIPPLSRNNKALMGSANVLNYTYAVLRDVDVNPVSTFGYNVFFFLKGQNTQHLNLHRFHMRGGVRKYACKEFVLMGSSIRDEVFGHMFHDFFLPMMLIPEEVRENAYVFCPPKKDVILEGLRFLGFPDHHIIFRGGNDWIHADLYHTVLEPLPFLCYYGACCRMMHERIMDQYKLHDVKNDKFVFCNRDANRYRHIANMDEIINATKINYPSYDWTTMPDKFPTLKETAENWVKIKFIFIPTGSNCVKCLALKPGSIMIVATARGEIDTAAMRTSISCDLFCVFFLVWNMQHFNNKSPNIVDIELALKAISKGIYALINKTLPDEFQNALIYPVINNTYNN